MDERHHLIQLNLPLENHPFLDHNRHWVSLPSYTQFKLRASGKYASRHAAGTNVVVLDPDVAKLFPDSESVNRALRACGEIMRARPRGKASAL